jgi:hypothetical protein
VVIQVGRRHQQTVEPSGQIAVVIKNADGNSRQANTGHRHMQQQPPVTSQRRHARCRAGRQPPRKKDNAGQRIAQRNALHHAVVTQVAEMEVGQRVQQEPNRKDQQRALAHLKQDCAPGNAAIQARAERQRDRCADDKQKERENHVGQRAAIPNRMPELRVGDRAITGVVDQYHESNRQTAQHVERLQARSAL